MATPTFFYPELRADDSKIELSELESAHALKSRRLGEGSPVQLINGLGLLAKGLISQADQQLVTVQIHNCESRPQTKQVSVATAIPKGDRQRTMIDMLTQLGVSQVLPLNCERSVTRYKPSMLDKWRRWAIEACKQSQNPWLPEIQHEMSIEEVLALPDCKKVFADELGQPFTSLYASPLGKKTDKLLILIGPEGGFSGKEQELLRSNNCVAISLGQTILRTELAAVVALVQVFVKDN